MKLARMIRTPNARTGRYCEYCGREETKIPSQERTHLDEIHLKAQPDGTMTCRECEWKHMQTPATGRQSEVTPIELANQQRREQARATPGTMSASQFRDLFN